jgi:hypothetical protein
MLEYNSVLTYFVCKRIFPRRRYHTAQITEVMSIIIFLRRQTTKISHLFPKTHGSKQGFYKALALPAIVRFIPVNHFSCECMIFLFVSYNSAAIRGVIMVVILYIFAKF